MNAKFVWKTKDEPWDDLHVGEDYIPPKATPLMIVFDWLERQWRKIFK